MKPDLLRAGECPGLDALAALRARPEAHPGVADHVKRCPSCEAELALFDRFERAEVSGEERADVDFIVGRLKKTPAPQRTASWFDWLAPRRWAMVAMLILAVGAGIEWNRQRLPGVSPESGSGVLRAAGRPEWLPGQPVTLSAVPELLEWKPVPDASGYRVTISEVDGEVVWSSEVEGAWVSLATAKRLFLPHKALLVRVSARFPEGQPSPESAPLRIRVE